jgi:hypothetical protein
MVTETYEVPQIQTLWDDPDFHQGWEMGPPSEPPDIRGMDHDDAIELMTRWFFTNFEEPAENTPWDDGEYVWIWGGPFYTRDEIESAFSDMTTQPVLDEVIAEIENHGCEWAPNCNRQQPEMADDPVVRAKQRLMAALTDWSSNRFNDTDFHVAEAHFPIRDVVLLLHDHHRLRQLAERDK